MAGHGSPRPLDTASDPARSGLPGIQPGDPTAGIGGMLIEKGTQALGDAFTKGMSGAGKLPGAAEGAEGAEAAGGLAEAAPLLAL